MSRRSQQRETVIHVLSEHVLKTGLSQTSVRQLAEAAGISDRMLLYYFENKADVMAAVLSHIAAGLSASLDEAVPVDQTYPPSTLFAKAAALTRGDDVQPFMNLWIEAIAAAARGEEPYMTISKAIGAGFLSWIEIRLEPSSDVDPKATAAMMLAAIDGLALLAVCADEAAVDRAIQAMTETLKL